MGEQLWSKAKYTKNRGKELAIEAPKTLASGTLREVIGYILSDEIKQTDLTDNETDIISEVSLYMEGYAQEELGKPTQHRLAVHMMTKEGTWHQEGGKQGKAKLEMKVKDYLLPGEVTVQGEKLNIDTLSRIFEQTPTIGADSKYTFH